MTETNFQLTDYPENFFKELDYSAAAALAPEWGDGDTVEIDPGGVGVITATMTDTFDFPVGSEDSENEGLRTIEASEDNPHYVVAVESGSRVVSEDEIMGEGEFPEGPGGEDAAKDLAKDGNMAEAYEYMEDPYSTAELLNIPGVDDPEVGWSDWPPSWKDSPKPARLIFLDMWTSLGGTFTTCRAEMAGRIRSPSRFCAASKDEALQTERWRNRF